MSEDPSTLSARTSAGQSSRVQWLIPFAVIFGLLTPLLFTDRTFATDWGNHLWLIWVQGQNIQELGEPSYFLQSTLGAFYPYYAFYGGTMYAVLGVLSWLTSPIVAVGVAYALALASAYLGWTWIARQAGIGGWRAQLPGCIAVTAPFAVTNLYGRGAIPEVIATSVIPLIAASALSLIRARRARLRDAALYVLGVAVLTGTHTLTLAWGSAFLLLVAALVVAFNWRVAVERARRGLALAGLTVLGVAINAWILVPLVLYRTRLAEDEPDTIGHTIYTEPDQLFSLFRNIGQPDPVATVDLNAQLPVLALLWALICGLAYWRFLSPANRGVALGLVGLVGAFLAMILSPSLIEELPSVLAFIQFPYRLLTYLDLALVGLVTLALAAMERDRLSARMPVLALAGIAVFSFGLAVNQVFEVRSWLSGRGEALQSTAHPPRSWYAPFQFADGAAPVVRPTLARRLKFPAWKAIDDSYAISYPPGPAGTVKSNILAGDYLIDLSGAEPVGRTPTYQMVIELPASPDRPRQVEVRAAWGPATTAARWLSIVSLLAALGGAVAYFVAGRRRAP